MAEEEYDEEYEEGYEEDLVPKDLGQVKLMYESILDSLIQQKDMMEDQLTDVKEDLDESLNTGAIKNLKSTHKMRYFLAQKETLSLTNLQIIKTYTDYIKELKQCVGSGSGGEDVEGLHKMIGVLEKQNSKLESMQQLQKNDGKREILLREENDILIKEIDFLTRDRKLEQEKPTTPTTIKNNIKTYGKRCPDCGKSIRGLDKRQLYCKSCGIERRKNQKKEWAKEQRRKKARENARKLREAEAKLA